MTVAAVTITYNRLALTKRTVESFYSKTNVDRHIFIDNGSTDGTQEWLKTRYDHIFLEKNYGIAEAFRMVVRQLTDYDFILKLDNDIETVTDDIINKMLRFYELNGMGFACSPVDLNLTPDYAPPEHGRATLNGYKVKYTSHTGGAFQLIPYGICERLCTEFRHLKAGDYMIGKYYRDRQCKPTYLLDLEMRHIGLNQTSNNYIL